MGAPGWWGHWNEQPRVFPAILGVRARAQLPWGTPRSCCQRRRSAVRPRSPTSTTCFWVPA
eukprot:2304849-Pyramimonas_sp.AAC.1